MTDDHTTFSAVYLTHLPAVSRYLARRVDAADVEDLAADVFAIAWRKRADVGAGEELPWLYRIASYQVANHRRRLAIRRNALAVLSTPDSAPAADAAFTGDPAVTAAWRTLPARAREILALVVLDDLSVSDAAVALGISANAASIRLHRAKSSFAAALAAEQPTTSAAGERSAPTTT